jgi:DNA-binding transcriptional MerR regulator
MSTQEGKYNVKAVSKMLGIQPGTLRAWERRYQIIAPPRNEAGHRLYTEEQVKILKWLVDKVNKGFTISQAVSLLENSEMKAEGKNEINDVAVQLQEDLLRALLAFEESRAHELMNKAFSLYTIEKVAMDILGTLLVRVGDLWEQQKITSAHEHFITSFLRSRIGMIFAMIPASGWLPKAVSVCGPDEWHELGLLIFTLYLRLKGYETIYLGASIAENDIDVMIEEVKPAYIFFSCTLKENVEKTLRLVDRLREAYPHVKIGLGGKGFEHISAKKREKYNAFLVGQTKEEWEEWLKNSEKYLSNDHKTM